LLNSIEKNLRSRSFIANKSGGSRKELAHWMD
jgi:hypothetical protein